MSRMTTRDEMTTIRRTCSVYGVMLEATFLNPRDRHRSIDENFV